MAESNKGRSVNRTQLSEIFGVSMPTVDSWVRNGCPIVKRGGQGRQSEFDTAAVARWLRDRAIEQAGGGDTSDDAEIERRTKKAKMLQAELELAKAKGDVAPVDEFRRVQASRYALLRQNILNVPQRAVLQLLGETDESTFKQKLRAELVLALESAAEAELDLAEEEQPQDDEA